MTWQLLREDKWRHLELRLQLIESQMGMLQEQLWPIMQAWIRTIQITHLLISQLKTSRLSRWSVGAVLAKSTSSRRKMTTRFTRWKHSRKTWFCAKARLQTQEVSQILLFWHVVFLSRENDSGTNWPSIYRKATLCFLNSRAPVFRDRFLKRRWVVFPSAQRN